VTVIADDQHLPYGRDRDGVAVVQIRRAEVADVPQIAELCRVELTGEPDVDQIADWVQRYPAVAACAPGGTLVGFCYSNVFAPDILELDNLLVARGWRDRQVGARILCTWERHVAGRFKAVILVNSMLYPSATTKRPAVAFYLRHGYTAVLRTEASCVLTKSLPDGQS
jgi:GNAT superfamily N-acetyltransferase